MAAVFVMSRVPIDPAGNVYHFYVSGDINTDGLAAGVGSLATRVDAEGAQLRKTGTGDTDWSNVTSVGIATNVTTIASGEADTIPSGHQAAVFGSLTVDGTLTVDGELRVTAWPS